jgi:hypothetical protein
VNWSDLQKAAGEAAGFEPVPAGTYDVVVDSAQAKPTSSGKNMIAVKFKVENGPYVGKIVYNQFVLSPDNENALAFFFRHMAALGLGEGYFATQPPLERVATDLTGRRCQIKVSIRQWQSTDRNNVDAVAPPAGGPVPVPAVSNTGLPGIPAAGPAPVTPGIPSVTPAPAPSVAPAPAPVLPPPPPVPIPAPAAEAAVIPAAAAPPPPPGMGEGDDLPF